MALCAGKALDVRELWELFLKDLLGSVQHDVSTLRASAKQSVCRVLPKHKSSKTGGSLALADPSQDHDMIDLVELTVPLAENGFKVSAMGLLEQRHCARA